MKQQQHLICASVNAGTVKRFMPSEFSYDLSSGASSTPELFEPKRMIQKQLQDSKLPYTIVSSNGFMDSWYLGQHNFAALCLYCCLLELFCQMCCAITAM